MSEDAKEVKTEDGSKPSVKRPTLDEGGGGGKFLKLLVVAAVLGGLGYFVYTKGYHNVALEKLGYRLTEDGIEKLDGGDGAQADDSAAQPSESGDGDEEQASATDSAADSADAADDGDDGDAADEKAGDSSEEGNKESVTVKEEKDGKPHSGYEWVNVTPENHIGGRKASAGYLRGKTVLVDVRDYGSRACVDDVKALQQIWSTYKTKEFVVIGCHTGTAEPERVAKIMDRLGLTYPVYKGAGLLGLDGEPVALSGFAVLDSTGQRFMHRGSDVRKATGIVGNLLFVTKRPTGAKAWKWLLDWEIENMPGHAFNRLRDFMADSSSCAEMRSKYPKDMQRYSSVYAQWQNSNEVKRAAKLVGLAVAVKDRDVNSAESKKITKGTLTSQINKYADLKESPDPRIVQEAKNAIADLTFAAAALKR